MPKFYFEIITLGFIGNPPTCTQANFTSDFLSIKWIDYIMIYYVHNQQIVIILGLIVTI